MPEYKLIYFNGTGRAEMTRWVFAAAGVNYEDCRLKLEEFQELKASGKVPFDQLPLLEVDGKILAQSMAICKYVAKETGFAPVESFEIAKADMIVDGVNDLMDKAVAFHREKNEENKQKLKNEFYENHVPHNLEIFEKILKSRGGKYFAENKLTYADIIFSSLLEVFQYLKGDTEPILQEKYPALKDLCSTVTNNPGIKKWLSERPANGNE